MQLSRSTDRRRQSGPRPSSARFLIWALCLLSAAACGANGGHGSNQVQDVEQSITQVLSRRAVELMALDGVEGVGEGLCEGAPCIRVYVRDRAAADRLPRVLDGYRVDPVVTGIARPLPDL